MATARQGSGRDTRRAGPPRTTRRGAAAATPGKSVRGGAAATACGGGYPQGQLTRRTGRPPRGPRAPPRPGAAQRPCSPGLGPRRRGSAISRRTLCRSRAQPPLPLGGGGGALSFTASAKVPAASGPHSRAAEGPRSRAAVGSAQPRLGFGDRAPRPSRRGAPPPPARWHSLARVGRRASPTRGGPRDGLVHSAPRTGGGGGGWAGPLAEGGGGGPRRGRGLRRGETTSPPPTAPNPSFPTPNSPQQPGGLVGG